MRGLDTAELSSVGATQIDPWNELVKRFGGDPNTAQAKFANRLSSGLEYAAVAERSAVL